MALVPPTSHGSSAFAPARNSGQVSLTAASLAVNTNATRSLAWVVEDGDADMLSLATATEPKPAVAGVYAISVLIGYFPTDATAERAFTARLIFDNDWYSGQLRLGGVTPVGGGSESPIAATWFCSVASGFVASVSTALADGAGTIQGQAYVQRIT